MSLLGAKIREIRTSKGISQRSIERRFGKYQGWLWAVETGKIALDAETLPELSNCLGVTISDLFM